MPALTPLDQWADMLEAVTANSVHLNRVVVLAETDSTQDACRRLGLESGLVVATGRQKSGRGRLGRTWLDTEDHGVALSVVLDDPRGVLPLAAPIATARALESFIENQILLKWPNDVLVAAASETSSVGRKLAGILIERTSEVAIVGIGINVGQSTWPEPVAQRAVSLRQMGYEVDRISVCQRLLIELDQQLDASLGSLREQWGNRDALRGQQVTVTSGKQQHQGIVEATDPTGTLRLISDGRVLELESATATIASI